MELGSMTKTELAKVFLEKNHPGSNGKKMTWQAIADQYGPPITKPMVWRIANDPDYEPKDQKTRFILGLSVVAIVIPINGIIPEGSLSLSAEQCACGQWYISNHPRRGKCFICSPARRKNANTR
jgi:hypothetical protein